ncbi:MAG TPA: hemolysin family protein [Candidatus Paceibacterota bacterium]|nr:hemolysin family protein [Candidatus Paceibacterota bacterium]HRT55842.1 hemolysin family protein [Candidatus Paceibacterota bacterium]
MDWDTLLSIGLRILAVAALVLLNGFFVASEFALVKIRDTQLSPLIRRGHRRARVADYILQHLDAFLSAAQLGITLASLGLGWIGEPVFARLLEPVFGWLSIESSEVRHVLAFAIGFSAITFLHISAGEQAPKLLAIQRPLPTTLWIAYPLLWFYRLSYPFVLGLNWTSQWLLRQAGLETAGEAEHGHSEDELRLLLAAARSKEPSASLSREILLNALDLRRRIVREVMRPRQEIVVLDTEATLAQCLDLAEKTRYSRFPLCENGDLDRMLGVIHIKDLYPMRLKALRGADLAPVARKIIYVPETARLESLLKSFLEKKLHVAIVVDEYGGTVGMVTLENILEELVGQIQDEFDQEKPLLVRTSENTWELAGSAPLHELQEILGEPLQEEGISTVSGWITQRLGTFPEVGRHLSFGLFDLEVLETDGMRVARLKITRKASPP